MYPSICPSFLHLFIFPSNPTGPSALPFLWHFSLPQYFTLTATAQPSSCALDCLGYEDVVVHKTLAEVAHNGVLGDLRQQHHVIHTTLLHIVTLPVKAFLAALGMGMGIGMSP